MANALIQVKNIHKKYGDFSAVAGVSFNVKKGEVLGLLGPNGAGKTTTVKMIECISPLTSGEILVNDLSAGLTQREIRRLLGVVPQEADFDNDLSVIQNLTLFADFFDIPRKQASNKIKELLAFVGLTGWENKLTSQLSGGMKQRLMIVRALLNDPLILILDEPTMGLDPQGRHLIWDKIIELKNRGITMLLTTHYMEEAHKLCDRIIIIDHGQILREGTPQELIDQETNGGTLEDVFLKLTGRGLDA